MIQIKLNGKQHKLRSGSTVAYLLKANDLDPSQVGVEINGSIIHQYEFKQIIVRNNDEVEIVEFVGGG